MKVLCIDTALRVGIPAGTKTLRFIGSRFEVYQFPIIVPELVGFDRVAHTKLHHLTGVRNIAPPPRIMRRTYIICLIDCYLYRIPRETPWTPLCLRRQVRKIIVTNLGTQRGLYISGECHKAHTL
jgi:hypothetical protein